MTPANNERRTLHYIAIFKLAKGCLLLLIACAFLFLDQRSELLSHLIEWAEDELMLLHNSVLIWLLNRFDVLLQAASLRTTGIVSLCYAIVLMTEGIGVWKQKRWAEWLMVVATASLVPLEVLHFIHKPGFIKVLIICANILIVVYLVRTLRRHAHHSAPQVDHPEE